MRPQPVSEKPEHQGTGKLRGKVAFITGGDSGIGRAIALLFAREGAQIAISYLNEHRDAKETQRNVEAEGGECLLFAGDIGNETFCKRAIDQAAKHYGQLNILVNNAAEQHPREEFQKISAKQLERTFRTNIFSFFFAAKAALRHLRKNDLIINTTSVTAYRGSAHLIDYSATKGAIVAFTRSLAQALSSKGIRVNGVAPGPVWTPLIASTFKPKEVAEFGSDVPMGRAGQPNEIAPCYLFLACNDSSYMTGQVLHPNGGEIING